MKRLTERKRSLKRKMSRMSSKSSQDSIAGGSRKPSLDIHGMGCSNVMYKHEDNSEIGFEESTVFVLPEEETNQDAETVHDEKQEMSEKNAQNDSGENSCSSKDVAIPCRNTPSKVTEPIFYKNDSNNHSDISSLEKDKRPSVSNNYDTKSFHEDKSEDNVPHYHILNPENGSTQTDKSITEDKTQLTTDLDDLSDDATASINFGGFCDDLSDILSNKLAAVLTANPPSTQTDEHCELTTDLDDLSDNEVLSNNTRSISKITLSNDSTDDGENTVIFNAPSEQNNHENRETSDHNANRQEKDGLKGTGFENMESKINKHESEDINEKSNDGDRLMNDVLNAANVLQNDNDEFALGQNKSRQDNSKL